MKPFKNNDAREVPLPWSSGLLSARISQVGTRTVAGVPELGLFCYGNSQTEAVFRLFTNLLKYFRQLKTFKSRLNQRALAHLELLSAWVEAVEQKMQVRSPRDKVLTGLNKK